MANQNINRIKLGVFVLSGLFLLILTLFIIGKSSSVFGSGYMLHAQFKNVNGLMEGNNVSYNGLVVGTVSDMIILNDTLIEVSMMISDDMKNVIRKSAVVSIGSAGLLGRKLVNISPSEQAAAFAQDGDILAVRTSPGTDEMLRTLSHTNDNITQITEALLVTTDRINNSRGLWNLLSDESLSQSLHKSLNNIRQATVDGSLMMADLHDIIDDVKNGKSTAGILLRDTTLAYSIAAVVDKMKTVADNADSLAKSLDNISLTIHNEINNGKGPANAILKDSTLVQSLQRSLDNIEEGTASFNENMEAMKHNFLFRGYFKKLEAQKYEEEQKKLKEQKSNNR